jgi:hypothetical protein
MAYSVAEAIANGEKKVLLVEALQKALEHAPPPPPGNDTQHFRLVAVELEFGGFAGSTKTRVTFDVQTGPLPPSGKGCEP